MKFRHIQANDAELEAFAIHGSTSEIMNIADEIDATVAYYVLYQFLNSEKIKL